MSLKFDHSQETLSASMGMPEGQTEQLVEKMTEITKDFVKSKGKLTKSEIAERIALELSYSELVFIATGKIFETLDKALGKHEELFSILEKLSEKFKGMKLDPNDED